MEVKKILHVIDKMDPKSGGVCQAVRSLIMGLEELGIRNEVVSLDDTNAPYIASEQFRIHAMGPGWGPWSYSDQLTPWFVDNLSRFEAIVLHGLWLYPNYGLHKSIGRHKARFKKENSLKVFIMPHGMLDPYFQKAAGRRLKAIRNWFYWKLIEGKIVNRADAILFTCEQERILARTPFKPYRPNREVVVGLGVEEPPLFNVAMSNLFLQACPEVKGHRYLLFLSRIHEKKGVDLLLKAYRQLKEFWNDELPFLVVAGPGMETDYGKKIKRQVSQDQKLVNAVFFPGMLTGEAKWGAFYGCEVFILPSHQENFGIAVVEAMACGKAVLISNQVNIWSEIREGGGGMVGEDTLSGTYGTVRSWLSLTEGEKIAMGSRAKKCFKRKFDIGVTAEKYLRAISL